jgi:hypothetical protein
MEKLQKIAYQGYSITRSQRLSDDGVIEYEFRNLGKDVVQINGISLIPLVNAANTQSGMNVFKETINKGEKNGKYYEIKFLTNNGPLLQVIEKRYVYDGKI